MRKMIHHIVLLVVMLWLCGTAVAQGKYDLSKLGELSLDSLKRLEREMPLDTNKLRVIALMVYSEDNMDSIYSYSNRLYDLSRQVNNSSYEAQALVSMQYCQYMFGDYSKSLDLGYKALEVLERGGKGRKLQEAQVLQFMGGVYAMTLNTTKADQLFHQSLERYKELKDTSKTIYTLTNIADNHVENAMYDEAASSYEEALELSRAIDNPELIAMSLLGLGSLKYEAYRNELAVNDNKARLDSAIVLLTDAYEKAEDSETKIQISSILVNALIEKADKDGENRGVLDSCRLILLDDYRLIGENNETTFIHETDLAWLNLLIANRQMKKAEVFADSLNTLYMSDTKSYGKYLASLYDLYSNMHTISNRPGKALEYNNRARYWQLKMRSNTYAAAATQSIAQAQFDEERRVRELEVIQNEMKLKEEKTLQMFISIASIIVLLLVGRNYYKSRKHNKVLDQKNSELESKNEEIAKQSEVIQEAHQEITDSISYALNIQRAALPSKEQLDRLLGDYMLYYRPLNIVSGDYYWATSVGGLKMVVAADCTGHGVPGAFVSMLGISILNDIATRVNMGNASAASVLDEMRDTFKQMLKQNGNEEDNRDGMDLALIIIDEEKSEIHYAGAFRPLIFIHEGILTKVDADRMPIGSHLLDKQPFKDNVIKFAKGDVFYIFSDGITDQFGYDASGNIKKFTAKRLNSLLAEISAMPFDEQKKRIEEAVDNWRSGNGTKTTPYEQTDDNILIGIRL